MGDMTMKKRLGFSLLCYALFFCISCFSPVLEDALPGTGYGQDEDGGEYGDDIYDYPAEEDNGDDGDDGAKAISHTSFALDAATGLPLDDEETNAAGKAIATLTVPETEGPWTPELDADTEDNGLFEIVETEGAWEVRIKGGPLPLGPYKVVVTIRNGAGKVYHRTIGFSVAKTPPPLSAAPAVVPYITTLARNKLVVTRNGTSRGATGYRAYIGTSANTAGAHLYGSFTGSTVEITDVDWDGTEGGLPDGTTYYVWCVPYNSEGEGGFGPAAVRKTSDPIDPYWWTDIDWWETIDSYEFYFNEKNELVIGYDTRGTREGKEAQCWIVRYHFSCDPAELNKKVPRTTYGHYTTNEDLTGAPAGVFIVETNRTTDPFYAVFYWGHRTIQTAYAGKTNPSGEHISLQGTVHSYLSNAWNNGGGYQATLEKAIATYITSSGSSKIANFGWVAFVATPWYPFKDGKYKYGIPVK
jgi:hypothetical protein